MSDSLSPEELDAQIELRRLRFKQVIADIRKVLEEDLRTFVLRESKRAFLGHPAVASAMDKERIAALKARSAELATSASRRVAEELADEGLWLATELPKEADSRDIVGARDAWAKITAVESELSALLSDFGLGDAEAPAYHAPAYFVGGLYMPSLAEHFWRLQQEIRALEEQKVQRRDDAIRDRLEAAWDDA